MARTHAKDWALERDMGWITRCGLFVDVPTRLSDEPTCHECRCWIGLCDQGCADICLRKAGCNITPLESGSEVQRYDGTLRDD